MAKREKRMIVANNNSYRSRSSNRIERKPILPRLLLLSFGVLMALGGIGALTEKDYPTAFWTMLIGVVLIVIAVKSLKKASLNNKLYKGLEDYRKYIIGSRRSETVPDFIKNYDKAIEAVETVAAIEPNYLIEGMIAEGQAIELKNDFQRRLRLVIDSEKSEALRSINYKYKHSLNRKEIVYKFFWQALEQNKGRFSDETKVHADEAVEEVYQATGTAVKIHQPLSERQPDQVATASIRNSGAEYDFEKFNYIAAHMATNTATVVRAIEETDSMNGLDFERWCAEVLRKNGFINVRVTPGSNDQGVDVLTEKEGIKYAIQCKCYSSDLGNTPVQEVNAGKKFYDCHVGVVMTNSHFTKGAVALAKKTGVLLWDREVVARMATKE